MVALPTSLPVLALSLYKGHIFANPQRYIAQTFELMMQFILDFECLFFPKLLPKIHFIIDNF